MAIQKKKRPAGTGRYQGKYKGTPRHRRDADHTTIWKHVALLHALHREGKRDESCR